MIASFSFRCGHISEVKQFNKWLGTLPHKHKIVIAGNHELSLDESFLEKGGIDLAKELNHRTAHAGTCLSRSSRYTINLRMMILFVRNNFYHMGIILKKLITFSHNDL